MICMLYNKNMWFKQAASSVWNATKSMLSDQRSPGKRLLDQISESQEEIISTAKLNELANLTYDLQAFQQIVSLCIDRIRVFKYDLDEAHKNLNMLIVINYLLKHGATAFVDEMREYIPTFKKYQTLQELKTYEDEEKQSKLNYELEKIKSRAQHIQTLLEDKKKLLKEKELSMLIKQKLKLYEKKKVQSVGSEGKGDYSNRQSSPTVQQKDKEMDQRMNKLDWMMEKYLWQYVDKIDDKLQEVSEKFMTKIDKYIIGEIPEKFELEDEPRHGSEESPVRIAEQYQPIGGNNDDDLMERLQAEINQGGPMVKESNLLEFEEFEEQKKQPAVAKESQLI